jgi:hypothetical protein
MTSLRPGGGGGCAQSPGGRSLNFIRLRLMFVGPDYGACFSSLFWCIHLGVAPKFGETFVNPYSSAAVAQLVEERCHKPEGRGIDSRWSLEFFIDIILPAAL